MNVLANVMSYYNNGESDIFHFVLGRILTNLDLLQNATIYDVAEYCSASPATISRLAQKLGYKNYSDLKHNVSDAVQKYRLLNRITPTEHITEPKDQTSAYLDVIRRNAGVFESAVDDRLISEIVKALKSARRVCFYSFGYCSTELHLQINLMLDGKSTVLCQRFSEQLKDVQQLDADCMVVIIAPENIDAVNASLLLARAKERGAKTLFITDTPLSPHRGGADYFLAYEGARTAVDMHFLYMFVDLINIHYRSRYIDNAGE